MAKKVRFFVDAADAAVQRNDYIDALNNYRLALQNTDDPRLKEKLASVEGKAKDRIFEINVQRGRTAERGERWAEAADYFCRAHSARSDGWAADRAAAMLRLAGGDMSRARRLAEDAVQADPNNAAYRTTLGEVCFAAGLFARAAGEAARALAITPNDTRAKALASAAKKKL